MKTEIKPPYSEQDLRDILKEVEGKIKKLRTKHNTMRKQARVIMKYTTFCEICLISEKELRLHVHHKKRLDDGGTNEKTNLIKLCPNCHQKQHKEDKGKYSIIG